MARSPQYRTMSRWSRLRRFLEIGAIPREPASGGSGVNLGGVYTLYPDADGDGVADNDDLDDDNDGWADVDDNCPLASNSQQLDGDGDAVGDACDNCISISNPGQEPSAVNPNCGAACETSGCFGLVCENH